MEVSIGDFGRMIFEQMTKTKMNPNSEFRDHWDSIRDKAEPLVKELIRLNNEEMMTGNKKVGYKLVGEIFGNKNLSSHERVHLVQVKLLSVKSNTLKKGDLCWVIEGGGELENSPCVVDRVTKKVVYLEGDNYNLFTVSGSENVLKAPDDWDENQNQYQYEMKDYWLKKADELGIE